VYIERLLAENFRNLESLCEFPHRRFNIYEGDNGQGKTNLLEVIAVLSGLRSFRTARLGECVRFGAERAQLGARVSGRGHVVDLGVEIQGNKSRVQVDGRSVARSSEALHALATVIFSAADLGLPHGEPLARRRWLDRAVFQHRPGYLAELRRFESAMSNRNALLRAASGKGVDGGSALVDPATIEAFDGVLAEAAAVIRVRRRAFIEDFLPHFHREFEAIAHASADATLRYRPHRLSEVEWSGAAGGSVDDEREELLRALRQRRRLDVQRGVTSVGPQRDDLEVQLAGRPAASHASAGQSRALVIAWRIAEIASLEATLGEPPVLLLDDLSSELDATRNEALMRHLDALGGQVFLTTTDARHIHLRTACRTVRISAGRLLAAQPTMGDAREAV